jgi:nitroreductase
MYFRHSTIEMMKKRRSCRTFSQRMIDPDTTSRIERILKEASNPSFRFVLMQRPVNADGESIGSYGIIRGANLFIAAVVKKDADLTELGAVFETIVLYCEDAGLSSCWLGGTFSREGFIEKLKPAKDEYIPIVIPVGYSATRSFAERLLRFGVRAGSRKQWKDLFFEGDFLTPLDQKGVDEFHIPLEMTRLAPSAVNRQPWRIIRDAAGLHFYMKRSMNPEKYGFDMQMIDMGIGIAHFVMAAKEQGIRGQLVEKDPGYRTELEYVRSWIARQ